MTHLNVEFKAKCEDPSRVRSFLKKAQAVFKGKDHQIDTYFRIPNGRLKLREGTIENNLIHYIREDQEGPKSSLVTLHATQPNSILKELLTKALGVIAVVDKKREVYFIDNVKFHIDQVQGLGSFIEVEAKDKDGTIGKEKLKQQCQSYLQELGITSEQLVSLSYCDLIQEAKS